MASSNTSIWCLLVNKRKSVGKCFEINVLPAASVDNPKQRVMKTSHLVDVATPSLMVWKWPGGMGFDAREFLQMNFVTLTKRMIPGHSDLQRKFTVLKLEWSCERDLFGRTNAWCKPCSWYVIVTNLANCYCPDSSISCSE
jgi:hypothetical protein